MVSNLAWTFEIPLRWLLPAFNVKAINNGMIMMSIPSKLLSKNAYEGQKKGSNQHGLKPIKFPPPPKKKGGAGYIKSHTKRTSIFGSHHQLSHKPMWNYKKFLKLFHGLGSVMFFQHFFAILCNKIK